VNANLSQQLKARKRRIEKRLQAAATGRQSPELNASNIHYEIAQRQQAIACGRACVESTAGQPRQQLGLHGDRLAGLEPQSLIGIIDSR